MMEIVFNEKKFHVVGSLLSKQYPLEIDKTTKVPALTIC